MAKTITADLHAQVMTCHVCGEELEIPRKLLRDQHALMILVDETEADHSNCAADPASPRRNREFRKRVQREELKASQHYKIAA